MATESPAPFSFSRLFKDVPPPEPTEPAAAAVEEPSEPLVVSKTAPYLDAEELSEASDEQIAATYEAIIRDRAEGEKARVELRSEIRVLEDALAEISEMQAPWAVALDKLEEERSLRASRAATKPRPGPRP